MVTRGLWRWRVAGSDDKGAREWMMRGLRRCRRGAGVNREGQRVMSRGGERWRGALFLRDCGERGEVFGGAMDEGHLARTSRVSRWEARPLMKM